MTTERRIGEVCLSLGCTARIVVVDFTDWLDTASLASCTAVELDSSDLTIGSVSVESSSTTDPYTGETIAASKAANIPITCLSTLNAGVRKVVVTPTDNSSTPQSEPMILELNLV